MSEDIIQPDQPLLSDATPQLAYELNPNGITFDSAKILFNERLIAPVAIQQLIYRHGYNGPIATKGHCCAVIWRSVKRTYPSCQKMKR